ncbi:MAG TPA: hypothetical protein VFT61_04770 [Sphingomicrobium sp.]|nr:hypothetical protein [Sphingomicrobium sp.]
MTGLGMAEPIVSLAEAQAFARIETDDEEALLAGLIRTASGLCEAFLGQVVIVRQFQVSIPATSDWQRLSVTPVRSIDLVETVASDGSRMTMAVDGYAIDVDSKGDGWVRLTRVPLPEVAAVAALTGDRIVPEYFRRGYVSVSGTAGIALTENDVPEPIRQGVLRLVASLFADRDGDGGDIPAAVTALWRPYRRIRVV